MNMAACGELILRNIVYFCFFNYKNVTISCLLYTSYEIKET